jgi:hypothetical protein
MHKISLAMRKPSTEDIQVRLLDHFRRRKMVRSRSTGGRGAMKRFERLKRGHPVMIDTRRTARFRSRQAGSADASHRRPESSPSALHAVLQAYGTRSRSPRRRLFNAGPNLAAFRNEIVVRIDRQKPINRLSGLTEIRMPVSVSSRNFDAIDRDDTYIDSLD